jgi:coenzyme F420-0:L-glutamate ligase
VTADHAVARLEIFPVRGIGELRPGDDLAAAITAGADLRDGDVVVVTSKVISKIEDRLIRLDSDDPDARETARRVAVDAETIRVVASRDDLRIVRTRHGLVLAAAGVDASNVARDELALLPVDPDASAHRLRDAVREHVGVEVGVIISDTMGRPWRDGLTDTAIGVAGVTALTDQRGAVDVHGNTLQMTQVAVADEIAAAADLVKGKLAGVPVAVVRGLAVDGKLPDDGRGSRDLVRDLAEDLFRLGTAEAIEVGRADALGSRIAPPPLHANAVEIITAMHPDDVLEKAIREAFLGFLAARPDAMWRSCAAGHLTASTIVLDPAREAVLLTLHPRAGLWLQVGGHCEPDDNSVLAAAAREALEESGISELAFATEPFALDVHPITCSLGVPTRHFDVQFLAVAPEGAELEQSDESLDLRWFGWEDLPVGVSPELPDLILVARSLLER